MSVSPRPVLEVRDIVKTFPGVRALNGVQFELLPGEVHALVGENGAGKSTLMHILGGVFPPDSGRILLAGKEVKFRDPHHAARNGIGVVYQELSLVSNLSIAENIFANRQPVNALGLVKKKALYARTAEMMQLFEMTEDPSTLVKRLSPAKQQVVEIIKALSIPPCVLILDEPTSSLTSVETELLFRNIRRLRQRGDPIIYISHHMSEIFEICDRVTIFRDGTYITTTRVSDTNEAELVRNMVGRELVNMYGTAPGETGPEFFKLKNVNAGPRVRNVSLSLRKGEILGISGLVGAGRTELARSIFGLPRIRSGEIELNGRKLRIASPADAIRNRIGYLTEDRKLQGLFLRMSIRENCIAPNLRSYASAGFLKEGAIDEFAESMRTKLRVVTPSIKQKVRNLSGGNQQKVLLAQWMGIQPEVLIVDEPTRGVDVGARSEIYALLRGLAATGMGVIMISSDLAEVLGLSDRVLVMRNGEIAGEFSREQATEENVIACATGVEINQ